MFTKFIPVSYTRNMLIALCIAAITASTGMATEKRELPNIVARINGVPIYAAELEQSADTHTKQNIKVGPDKNDAEYVRRLQLTKLDALIDQELLAQAGASLKLQDTEEKLAKRLANSTAKTDTTPQTKEQREELSNKLRKEILSNSYLEHKGLLNIKVDEQTLRQFYDTNRNNFLESKSVKANHILIRLPKNPTAEQEQEAHDKASKILAELKQGKDFAILAIQSSDCSSKDNGGSLGFIKQDFMPKSFNEVAFKLKPGETSGIVKTRFGLHIIRVDETKPESIREFDKVKEFIAGYLQKDYQRRKVDELVGELKKSAKIELFIK